MIHVRFFLWDLLNSVAIEELLKSVGPPDWHLVAALGNLRGPVFDPSFPSLSRFYSCCPCFWFLWPWPKGQENFKSFSFE